VIIVIHTGIYPVISLAADGSMPTFLGFGGDVFELAAESMIFAFVNNEIEEEWFKARNLKSRLNWSMRKANARLEADFAELNFGHTYVTGDSTRNSGLPESHLRSST
jgi:hypothetical protein